MKPKIFISFYDICFIDDNDGKMEQKNCKQKTLQKGIGVIPFFTFDDIIVSAVPPSKCSFMNHKLSFIYTYLKNF